MNYSWKVFKHYGIDNVDSLAVHCLRSLDGLDILTQLRQQKIVLITRKPILHTGGIQQHIMAKPYSGFDIILNDLNDQEKDISTVPHEIGHTFEVCFGGSYLRYPGCGLHLVQPSFLETSENFAEAFAQLWLKVGDNRARLAELLHLNPASLPLQL